MANVVGQRPAVPEIGVVGLVPEVWGGVWMSRHQLMTRLGRYFQVLWEDPAPEWRDAFSSARPRSGDPSPAPGFRVHRPHRLLPVVYRPRLVGRILQATRIRMAVRRLRQAGAQRIVLYIWRPQFDYALDLDLADLSCYHVVDEYTFSPEERPVSEREARLLRRADRVIIHSPGLWEKKSAIANHPTMVPNGVDYTAFASPVDEPEDLRALPAPRIGYVGVMKQFLNVPLLLALAQRHPGWSFVFVGPVGPMGPDAEALDRLRELSNVHLLGMRRVEQLPAYTQHLDVGILPYDIDGYTKFIYPLKLHEYLAAGIPVVGTPIRTLQDFGTTIQLAEGVNEWSDALKQAVLPEEMAPDRVTARRRVACDYDWSGIAHRVAKILAEAMTPEIVQAVAAAAPAPVGPCADLHSPTTRR